MGLYIGACHFRDPYISLIDIDNLLLLVFELVQLDVKIKLDKIGM